MSTTDTLHRTNFVEVPGNPAPDGASISWVEGDGGRRVRVCLAPSPRETPRGTTIVCPGRTEFIEKYFEVARELQARGFAVMIVDWPGQGLSERLLDDRAKGHVDHFSTFTGALRTALDTFAEQLPAPHVVLAHSMGGAISLSALTQKLVHVEAAAFSAPMWGLPVNWVARLLVKLMQALGRSNSYAMRPGPAETFETNIVTHDRAHWQRQHDLIEAEPDLALGQLTWGWLGASLDSLDRTIRPALLRELDIPVFVASAAEEKLVANKAHAHVASHLPDCEHVTVAGARHEILMETEARRAEFWAGFDRLLRRADL